MPTPILMPALSPTMEVGTLAKWLVKEGDAVAPGDVIAEIETDKATMEVEAVDEGTMGKILIAAGTGDVPVNQPIALLLDEGEDASALASASASAPAPAPPQAPAAATDDGGKGAAQETQAAAEVAPGGAADATRTSAAPAPAKPNGQAGRIIASPLARRMAEQNGIDLTLLAGSGPHGRIVKRDIDQAVNEGVPAPKAGAEVVPAAPGAAPTAPPVSPGLTDAQIRAIYASGSYEELPHDGMRKTIARRLVEAKQTIPHFYLTIDLRLDPLLALRKQLNDAAPTDKDGKPGYKLSVNDFIIKAWALALQDVPMANATYTSTARLLHKASDVGVAVAIPDGLTTPVIRDADKKTLSAISNEMKDLAKRARERKLKPEDYQGGTTAVSNLGMFGIREFAAVINPPHSTILAVGEGQQRPIVEDGAIVAATILTATLSVDHRAVDGALGAELMAAFKPIIEKPMRMLV